MGSGISIAIPVHPPRLTDGRLDKALASCWAQTLLPDAVSIAVDNGRKGAWHTRQRALDAVTTPWVAFLDSDDWLDPPHLALHEEWARNHDADYVYSWFQVEGDSGPIQADPFPPEYFTEPWWPDRPRHTTMTVMVRTELAKRVGFTEPIPNADVGHEDWRFTMGCVEAGAKIVHIPGVRTWRWGWHHENTSGLPNW